MLKSKSNQNKNSDDISSKLRFEDIKELLNKRKKVAKNDDILVKKSNAATKASKLAGVKKKSKSKVRLILSERMAEKKAEKSTAALESTRSSHKSGVVNLEDAVKNAVQENDGTFETIVRNVITSAPASVRRPLRSKTSGVSSVSILLLFKC